MPEEFAAPELDIEDETTPEVEEIQDWPDTAVGQIGAIQDFLGGGRWSVEDVASALHGARRDLVERHLETLALMGEVVEKDGLYEPVLPDPATT